MRLFGTEAEGVSSHIIFEVGTTPLDGARQKLSDEVQTHWLRLTDELAAAIASTLVRELSRNCRQKRNVVEYALRPI